MAKIGPILKNQLQPAITKPLLESSVPFVSCDWPIGLDSRLARGEVILHTLEASLGFLGGVCVGDQLGLEWKREHLDSKAAGNTTENWRRCCRTTMWKDTVCWMAHWLQAIKMKRWNNFLTSLGLDKRVDFEEGDIGLPGGHLEKHCDTCTYHCILKALHQF